MANYYLTKYPTVSGKNIIHLPVYDYGSIGKTSAKGCTRLSDKFGRPVTDGWRIANMECVDLMLKAVNDVRGHRRYWQFIRTTSMILGGYSVNMGFLKTMFGGNVNKKFLADVYRRSLLDPLKDSVC